MQQVHYDKPIQAAHKTIKLTHKMHSNNINNKALA